MKKQSPCLFKQMNINELEELTNMVNENFTEGNTHYRCRKLTVAELWNIQRQGRERIYRRVYF